MDHPKCNGCLVRAGFWRVCLWMRRVLCMEYPEKTGLVFGQLCELLDGMMSGKEELPEERQQEEGLFYKIHYRLKRLYEVMQENRNHIAKEREDLQELISDISHQVKTPIANLKMINNTLLEQEFPAQKQQEFLTAQKPVG